MLLCSRLANLASGGPSIRYKESRMPFVQMENISHFLRACQTTPLNLQPHDIFQTVDLYEAKDPAQVLQCIVAFSRRAHAVQPSRFATAIGGKGRSAALSPQSTGGYSASGRNYPRSRGASNTSDVSSTTSNLPPSGVTGRDSSARPSETDAAKSVNGGFSSPSSVGVSSWSKKADEGATTPAWNIHQYGYMGGASQGNQGITFGGRRQITTPAPKVPSLAERELIRREKAAEAEISHALADEAGQKQSLQREADEERDRVAGKQRWIEEARQQREQEKAKSEAEKATRQAEARKWKDEDEAWAKPEREASEPEVEANVEKERQRKRVDSDARLNGQFLSKYQAEQRQLPPAPSAQDRERAAERVRVKELERELEKAREREQEYERKERERLLSSNSTQLHHKLSGYDICAQFGDEFSSINTPNTNSRPLPKAPSHSHKGSDESWQANDEREFLRGEWKSHNPSPPSETPTPPPPQPPRPLPIPQLSSISHNPSPLPPSHRIRPLPPSPTKNPSLSTAKPISFPTRPSSFLSREMELDRLRQREWEDAQKEIAAAAADVSEGRDIEGTRPGEGAWDVNQYGYLGGDSQNRGGPGLGGRRQIIGPRLEIKR